jgi:hypothetical protein
MNGFWPPPLAHWILPEKEIKKEKKKKRKNEKSKRLVQS